jgi:predicted ATPase
MSLFKCKLNSGFYLLDEPEAALSPLRQLSFLRLLWELDKEGNSQFIIVTHSPIIMAYPNAVIYNFNGNKIQKIDYEDTEHYLSIHNSHHLHNAFLYLCSNSCGKSRV